MSGGGGASGAPASAEGDMECVVKEEPAWEAEGALWAALCGGTDVKRALGLSRNTIYAEDVGFALPEASEPENDSIFPAPTEGAQGPGDAAFHTDPEVSGATHSSLHNDKPIVVRPPPMNLERTDIGEYIYYYQCPICHKVAKKDLKRHLLTHTQEEIDTVIDVRKHGKGKFECHFCGVRFIRRRGITEHLNVYAKLDPFQQQLHAKMPRWKVMKTKYECDACGKQMGRKERLARHLERHEDAEPVTCGHCNEPFKYEWDLLDHIKRKICNENNIATPNIRNIPEVLKLNPCFVKLERLNNIYEIKTAKTFDKSLEINSENDLSGEENLLDDAPALGTDEETFYCGVCEEQFDDSSMLGEHQCKRIKKPFSCEICNKRFMHQCLLDTHTRIHTGEKPFSCKICNKSFRIKAQLKNHKVIHSKKKPTCDLCDKQFASTKSLKRHKLLLHMGEKPNKPYSCDMCNKKYKSLGELETHTRSHTGEKLFTCDVCKKQYLRKQQLVIHLQIHTDEKYPCPLCDKQSSTSNGLKKHMKLHTGDKPYSCGVCNKRFRARRNFDNHKRVHTGEKPFKCELCPKRFKQKAHVYKHQRRHMGVKPFSCSVCNKQFSEMYSLRQHSRVHTGEKPYSCDMCEKTFSHTVSLKLHKRVHTGEKPFACGVCKKAFSRKERMNNHMQCHSKDWPFSCDICQRRFRKKDYLKLHKKVHNCSLSSNLI